MFIACADLGEGFPCISVGGHEYIEWAAANTWGEIVQLCSDLDAREQWAGNLSYIYEFVPGEYGYRTRWYWGSDGWTLWND